MLKCIFGFSFLSIKTHFTWKAPVCLETSCTTYRECHRAFVRRKKCFKLMYMTKNRIFKNKLSDNNKLMTFKCFRFTISFITWGRGSAPYELGSSTSIHAQQIQILETCLFDRHSKNYTRLNYKNSGDILVQWFQFILLWLENFKV